MDGYYFQTVKLKANTNKKNRKNANFSSIEKKCKQHVIKWTTHTCKTAELFISIPLNIFYDIRNIILYGYLCVKISVQWIQFK